MEKIIISYRAMDESLLRRETVDRIFAKKRLEDSFA